MRLLTRSLLTIFTFLFLFGCASQQLTIPSIDTKKLDADNYTSKVDNFIILFDASSSMNHAAGQSAKFDIAKTLAYGINSSIPELGQTAGLRSFGHAPDLSKEKTILFYGMEKYSTRNLDKGIDKITKAGGYSPVNLALDATADDLDGLSGDSNAVIIISDGLDMEKGVLTSARKLKAKYGSSICFYPILVGDSKDGAALLQKIADIGGCGFYSTADELMSYAGMADFVEMVFLDEKPASAPKAPVVSAKKDSDNDGVYDGDDKCPGTPAGATVNAVGCWVLDNVLFDFDKSIIKSMAYPLLDDVVKILKQNPAMNLQLNGHCDNVGTPAYNMDLSLRRANAVRDYIVKKGILWKRLDTQGFGFTQPVALNGTDSGRAMNRRVELDPS
ncbi:MAG: OmpA family protein [Deltaproteobacteria bacterium]|nr:OmpA family protein [Deltaproteobacteria bacterium]